MSEDQSEDTGINVLVIEQDGQLFAVPVTSDLPMETPSLEIPGSSAIVPDDRNTLRFANFRVPGKRNRCEPCTCRTRSDFYFLDDGSAYNVDSSGTIWYQAAYSFTWEQLYRCRNYIPWSNGVSRLDHVMRDEQGFPGRWSVLSSRRIPCGRPDSGSFIGFQTDVGSCVVFYKGKIVYEGSYRSDSNGSLGISTTDDDITLSVGSSEYRNWITEECEETEDSCNVCNNNDSAGNDRELFRNTDGKWSINGSTGTWTHTDETTFVKGEVTPVFSQSVTFIDPPCPTCYFGWGLGGGSGSSTEETGMHLGTNESGSVVWFTTKKRSDRWWRFAGIVETEDDLPDIIKQPSWKVVDEYGKPYSVEPKLRDFDVIVVRSKEEGEGSKEEWDYRDGKPYYLKDSQWIEHESETYADLVMSWATACILYEELEVRSQKLEEDASGEETATPHATSNSCLLTSNYWLGNAMRVQACGDVVLVNGNVKELDRLLIYQGKVIASEKAIGRNDKTCEESSSESSEDPQEEECITLKDSVECAYSRYYWAKDFTQTELCKVADGYVFARFTQADGSVRHVLRYFNGSEWVGEWETTTPPGEPVWESGIQSPLVGWWALHNVFWLALGRTMPDETVERLIFHRGSLIASFIYDPALYQNDSFRYLTLPVGLFSTCTAIYTCPESYSGIPKYIIWDENGNVIVGCTDLVNYECMESTPIGYLPWAFSMQVPMKEKSYSWTYSTRLSGGATPFQSITVTEVVRYQEIFIPALGEKFYSGGQMTRTTRNNTTGSTTYDYFGCDAEHWSDKDLHYGNSTCQYPLPNPYRPVESVYPLGYVGIGNISLSMISTCGNWYKDEPEVIGEVQMIDNDLEPGALGETTDGGFDITLCALVGSFPAASGAMFVPRPTILIQDTCEQKLKFPETGSGKWQSWQPNPGQVHTTNYKRPIWNRVFWRGDSGGMPWRYLAFGEWTRDHVSYMGVKVMGDANGLATDSLMIDHLEKGAASELLMTTWRQEGSAWKRRLYYLEQETFWYADSIGSEYEATRRYTTHVWEIEAQQIGGRFVNASATYSKDDYLFTIIEQPGDSPLIFGRYYDTLFYKLCSQPWLQFWVSCDYTFIAEGSGQNQFINVTFRGKQVYTSPTVAQIEQGDDWWYDCCNEGYALVIGEVIDGVTTYRSWVEGNPAMTSSERIDIIGCCATHRVINQYEYRYALLGTGDYLQEPATEGINTCQDFLDKWNKAEAEAEENEEEPEYPEVFLTDGTKIVVVAGRIETEDGAVIDHTDPDTTSLLKTTITDTRERMLFCNGAVMGSNKRYDGLYCCDEYAICVYVDDDDLSGWKSEGYDYETWTYTAEQKYTPHPGWLDKQPPAAKNRTEWDRYKSLYPGFAVDVFHQGEKVGTYRLSDANSPIYYDKRIGSWVWELLTIWYKAPWDRRGIGAVPWALEGTPKCGNGKLLIPYDGGLTTVMGGEAERIVFP